MAEEDDSIKVVDEKFWLGWAAKTIESTAGRIDDGSAKVAAAMAWFWGAYTAIVVAVAVTQKLGLSDLERTLLALPAVVLFAAYAFATWAAMPQPVAFDPRKPWQVKKSYDQSTRRKWCRLRVSLVLAAIAAVIVGVAVFLQFSKSKLEEPGVIIKYNDSSGSVLVGGTISPNTEILIEATSPDNDRQAVARSSSDGTFQQNMKLPAHEAFHVSVRWESPDHYATTVSNTVNT